MTELSPHKKEVARNLPEDPQMTRDEHLAWCKARAMEYLQTGHIDEALAAMISDLSKHPETKCSDMLLRLGLLYAINWDYHGMKRWIEGFR